MKKLNLILTIIIAVLLSACGSGNQENGNEQNADSTELANEAANENGDLPYMTLSSKEKVGNKICIQVFYPEGEKVWIDWNDNKQLDEGEELKESSKFIGEYSTGYATDIYCDGYSVDKNISLKNNKFTICGNVKGLYCPEAGITEIDISHNPHLENLFCHDNDLSNLDISKNENLKLLFCANNDLTDLDISHNPNLEFLTLPRSIKSKIFDFTPETKELVEHLNTQNLIPKGYHILWLAKKSESDFEDLNKNDDKLVFFIDNIPYAEREGEPNSKLIYFKSIGKNKYKKLGEVENTFFSDLRFVDENNIVERIWESMEECKKEFYKVEDGKIVKSEPKLISVEPNAEGIYEVKTAEELLGSIASNRTIKIIAPKIDLTNVGDDLIGRIKYTDLEGIILDKIKNLKIIGGLNQRTEILLDHKQNTVLILKESENIRLENLRMGHTPQNDGCSGAVLGLFGCKNIELDNLELYGCGTQGISATTVDKLKCTNTLIDHCTFNALKLFDCKNFIFENIEIKNNECFDMLIDFGDTENILFEGGKIVNNESEPLIGIEGESINKNIVFKNVDIKNNKTNTKVNINNEEVIKFIN